MAHNFAIFYFFFAKFWGAKITSKFMISFTRNEVKKSVIIYSCFARDSPTLFKNRLALLLNIVPKTDNVADITITVYFAILLCSLKK